MNELTNSGMIGKSPAMLQIYDLIHRIANVQANVLIQGECGTGKELIARAVHAESDRNTGPFIAINCAAIPESLLESELFGHAKGAFTGAVQKKKGLFEEANGGTLFLDEIGDMTPGLQSKLLRVIQERRVRSVGENQDRPIDVRIIAATHQDLKHLIGDGQFRDDLYYRLSVIPIKVPPLRERSEDIPLLAEYFLQKYVAANSLKIRGFTQKAMARLLQLPWFGNVRELENVIERATVLCLGTLIDERDIPLPPAKANPFDGEIRHITEDIPTLAELEKRYVRYILERTHGRKDFAARILGINRRTLYRKEREFGFVPSALPTPPTTASSQPDFFRKPSSSHDFVLTQ